MRSAPGDLIVLAIPAPARQDALINLGDLKNKIVVDATNLNADWSYAGDVNKSGAEQVQEWAKGAKVVKAFNTAFAQNMTTGKVKGEALSLLVAGDDKMAKERFSSSGSPSASRPSMWVRSRTPDIWRRGFLNIQLGYTLKYGTDLGFKIIGTSMKIQAAVVRELKAPLTIVTRELDEPRPNEARVRLVATGVCHTDAIVRDGIYPMPLPAVLGHEGAGVVEQVGSEVRSVKVGDHVVMSAAYCTHCIQCRSGQVAYCENLFAEDFGGKRTSDGTTSLKSQDGQLYSNLAKALSNRGVLALVGAARPGTEVPFEIGASLMRAFADSASGVMVKPVIVF